ncbi:exosortase-associated EpsI family protein [Planctomycetales bacterium ZRK34]|nr:exosortase-associated EpsI family protein [Planctomycetales bacterium ZRK34]
MSLRKAFNPSTIIVLIVLFAGLIGLQSVVSAFELFLMKDPISLRRRLYLLPERVGPYQKVGEETLSKEIVEELGTEQYISWTYQDTNLLPDQPGAMLRLHVAYYTGTPDAVPHVPERCYVGGGATPRDIAQVTIPLQSPLIYKGEDGQPLVTDSMGRVVRLPSTEVPVRMFDFIPHGGKAEQQATVLYFFAANGSFTAIPEHVRALVFDLSSQYAYWCKIEVLPHGVTDHEKAQQVVGAFLSKMLPEIMGCLPDWHEVRAGNYPVKKTPKKTTP